MAPSAKKGDGGGNAGRWMALGFLVVGGIGVILQVAMLLMPTRLDTVPLHDRERLNAIFYGGQPHVIVCANDTSDSRVRDAVERAIPALSNAGITPVGLDCDSPLPSSAGGVSLATKFGWQRSWKPTTVFVAHGKAPVQLPPTLMGKPATLVDDITKRLVNKVGRISNGVDLTSCVRDRAGGCVIMYASRDRDDATEALAPAASAHAAVKFAAMDARQVAFQATPESPANRLLNGAIRAAKEAAAVRGSSPMLLVVVTKAPPAAGLSGGGWMLTTHVPVDMATVTPQDVARLLQRQRDAVASLARRGDGGEQGHGVDAPAGTRDDAPVDIDALLERDDALFALDTAVATPKEVQIVFARKSKPKAAATPTPDAAARQQVASDAANARREARARAQAASQQQGDAGDGEAEEGEGERQRRRRAEMVEEEAQSGHVAHLAREWDDEEGGKTHTGTHEWLHQDDDELLAVEED